MKPQQQEEPTEVPPVVQDLIPFENKSSGLWGYRNQKTGKVVIEPKFDEVGEFSNGQVWGKNSHGGVFDR